MCPFYRQGNQGQKGKAAWSGGSPLPRQLLGPSGGGPSPPTPLPAAWPTVRRSAISGGSQGQEGQLEPQPLT